MTRVIVLLLYLAASLAGCAQTQAVREEEAVNAILFCCRGKMINEQ